MIGLFVAAAVAVSCDDNGPTGPPFEQLDSSLVRTATAARGKLVFDGAGRCATCHTGSLYTDVNSGRLHAPSETGMDARYAERTSQKAYRTTLLRGLAQHAPYFHDGSAASLADVVDHYDQFLSLGLTAAQKQDLIAYLQTL